MAQHETYSLGIDTNFDSVLKANKAINAMYEGLKKVDNRFSGMHAPRGLPAEINHMSAVTASYVQRLESEGKTYEANKVKSKAYAESLNYLNRKQKSLETQLGKIAEKSGKTSQTYKEQQVRINATATSINHLQKEMDKLHPTGFNKVSSDARRASKAVDSIKSHLHNAFDNIKVGAGVVTAGIGAIGASAISGAKKLASVQQNYKEITNLAVLGGEKQKEVTKAVKDMQAQGRDMSIKYGKSQKEIAAGYEDLVKRGYTTKQALGAMRTELQASVASGDQFSDVTTVSSQVLDAFGMRAKTTAGMIRNTKKAVNELAYSADATSTGFKDLGIGMSYVGTAAKANKLSLAETASAMGVLSNNGLEADKAGTGLRSTINGLTSQINKIGKKNSIFDKLGIKKSEMLDAHGNLKSLSTDMAVLYKHIQEHSHGGAQANGFFKSIFGTSGMNAAMILAKNSKEVQNLTKRTAEAGKSGTYVAKMAERNSATAQMQMARAKQATNAFKMELGAKLLPAINEAGNAMAKFLTTKDGKQFEKDVGGAVSKVANGLVNFIKWGTTHKGALKAIGGAILAGYTVAKGLQFVAFLGDVKKSIDALKGSSGILSGIAEAIKKVNGAEGSTVLQRVTNYTASKIAPKPETIPFSQKWQLRNSGFVMPKERASLFKRLTGTGGALQSMKSAGGFKGLSTVAKGATIATGAGIVASSGVDLYKAITTKNPKSKFKHYGRALGSAIGGSIGLWFGGPAGAAVGTAIGKVVGGWAGKAARRFSKSKFGKAIGHTFKQTVWSVKQAMRPLGRTVHSTTRSVSKSFKGMSRDIGKDWRDLNRNKSFKAFKNFMKSGMVAIVRITVKEVGTILKSGIKVAGGVLKTFASSIKMISRVTRGVVKVVSDIFHGRWRKAWKDAKGIVHAAVAGISGMLKGLHQAVSGVFGFIGGTVKNIADFVDGKDWRVSSHRSSPSVSGANARVNRMRNGSARNYHAKSRLNNVASNNYAVTHLRTHATGGKITASHHALVGEAGPELAYKRGSNARLLGTKGPQITRVHAGEHILNARDTAKVLSGGLGAGTILKGYASGTDRLKTASKSVTNDYKDIADKSTKSLKKLTRSNKKAFSQVNSDASKQTKQTKTRTVANFNSLHKNVSKLTARTKSQSVSNFKSMHKGINKQMDAIHDGVISSGKSTAKGFGGAMDKMHKYAHSAMADTTRQLNKGISSIDKVLGQFGGNNSVIKPIKFAKGTDQQGRLTHNTLAMVNDATQGPRQEALVSPDNKLYLPKGQNFQLMLPAGWGVLNGTQTKQIINKTVNHFAKGTGISHSALRRLAERAGADPTKWFKSTYSNDIKQHGSDLNKGTTALGSNSSTKYGNPWSNALWSVINKQIDSDDGGSINATGLLKAAEKYGEGHKYVWGATGPNTFDCSGLVMYTLKHAYGIDYPHFSGSQYNMTRHISKGEAHMGDLVFWGSGGSDHVGIYAGGNKYFSAESPAQGIHMNTLDSVVGKGRPLFGRIKGMPNQKSKATHVKKPNSRLTALVKRELGASALKWIKDKLGEEGGSFGNPAGDGVTRWRKYITRAASQMHTSVTDTEIAKILSMISSESSGNPTITQQIQDINSAKGTPAQGLLQFVPNTFNAFAAKGHHKLLNGYDQLLALFNDSNWRNDIHFGGGWGPSGHRRFAKGGKPIVGKNVIVGEHGPEIARFTDPVQIYSNEKSRRSLNLGKLPDVQHASSKKHFTGKFAPVININFNGSASDFDSKRARKIAEIVQRELEKVFNSIDEEFC